MLNDKQALVDEGKETEEETISDKLVLHLLQLQDIGAIENLHMDCNWGYEPLGDDYGETMDDGFTKLISASFETRKFVTPHCYESRTPRSVIRLTAIGHQLRDTLESDAFGKKVKKAAMIFGKDAIAATIQATISGAINATT